MPTRTQTNVQQSGDDSTVQELLNTEKFIASVRKHFGLTKEPRTVCVHCGNQLKQANNKCLSCGNPAEGKTKKVWVEQKNSLMNRRGVEAFVTTLRTNVDRNQIASNFDQKEIKNITKSRNKINVYDERKTSYGNKGVRFRLDVRVI